MSSLYTYILELERQVVQKLGLPSLDALVTNFLSCLNVPEAGCARVQTVISNTGFPAEFSFTGRPGDMSFRLLSEPLEPGGTVVGRCYLGVRALSCLLDSFCCFQDTGDIEQAITDLLPPGEELAASEWHSTVWLSLRADDRWVAIRAYINMNGRPPRDRYLRMQKALYRLGLHADAQVLPSVAAEMGNWATPIGISWDFFKNRVLPARIHFHPSGMPYRRLVLLLNRVAAERCQDVVEFLESFGIAPGQPCDPYPVLLSLGLEDGKINSLKFDVTIRALSNPVVVVREKLPHLEAKFGTIEGRARAGSIFHTDDHMTSLQYIGLTVTQKSECYLNVYYAPPLLAHHRCTLLADSVSSVAHLSQLAVRFLLMQQHADGSFRMEARSLSRSDPHVPDTWHDIYVAALIYQEAIRLRHTLPATWIRNLCDHIIDKQESGLWRYLPDLPYDADDTAMAVLCLTGIVPSLAETASKLLQMFRAKDGGFVTFQGSDLEEAHPAVSLNVVHALHLLQQNWDCEPTKQYLNDWIFGQTFPNCQWSYSPLLTLFLLSRNPVIRQWFGDAVAIRCGTYLGSLRRKDSTWGNAGPETLETALAVLTYDNLGLQMEARDDVLEFLSSVQMADGGFCWSPIFSNGSGMWFGHRALTTLLVLRALETLITAHPGMDLKHF